LTKGQVLVKLYETHPKLEFQVASRPKQGRSCPLETRDLAANLKNRKIAIRDYGYGPMNPELDDITVEIVKLSNQESTIHDRKATLDVLLKSNPNNYKFWVEKAMLWGNKDIRAVMSARCGNCIMFDDSPKMIECIKSGIFGDQPDTHDVTGDLGYCVALKFKCAASRTCDAWVTKKKANKR
jgi:hypothetical protein